MSDMHAVLQVNAMTAVVETPAPITAQLHAVAMTAVMVGKQGPAGPAGGTTDDLPDFRLTFENQLL